MRPRPPILALCALALAAAGPAARAEPPIATGDGGAPPVAQVPPRPLGYDDRSPEAIGAWARGVMADAASPGAAQPGQPAGARTCVPASPDGKPHGEVWAGAGTHGYREAGGVVTEPLGQCGQLTIGISTSGGRFR